MTDTTGFAVMTAILGWLFMSFILIYTIVNTVCLCKTHLRTGRRFKCNIIVYASISLIMSLLFWILALISLMLFSKKVNALKQWSVFSPCVDKDLKITKNMLSDLHIGVQVAAAEFGLACFILTICVVNFIGQIRLVCCTKK